MPSPPPAFRLTRRLRRGHTSVVWRCKRGNTAAKQVVKFVVDEQGAREEVQILCRFWHPNVIDVVDFVEINGLFGIVMSATDMDLRQFMETELYDSVTVCDFSRQCARGLHHVHSLEILHADVKPENIGISIAKRTEERIRIHVRILDFGSAKQIGELGVGSVIRSTLHYQSPEKRSGIFHFPGDIYELGIVYQEVIDHSVDSTESAKLYGGLVSDMTQSEFQLRPTSQQVLIRLEDPQKSIWDRVSMIASEGMKEERWKEDFEFLVGCEDPLSFLMSDLQSRINYIARLANSDNVQHIERAFFFLYKTAQREVVGGECCNDFSVLHFIHLFHGVVDTTWWTKLFYCMAIDQLSRQRYFGLTDVIKIKLWIFSRVDICRYYVINVLSRCMNDDLLVWCMARQWGHNQTGFTLFINDTPSGNVESKRGVNNRDLLK